MPPTTAVIHNALRTDRAGVCTCPANPQPPTSMARPATSHKRRKGSSTKRRKKGKRKPRAVPALALSDAQAQQGAPLKFSPVAGCVAPRLRRRFFPWLVPHVTQCGLLTSPTLCRGAVA